MKQSSFVWLMTRYNLSQVNFKLYAVKKSQAASWEEAAIVEILEG